MTAHEDGIYCERPGQAIVKIEGTLGALERDTPDNLARVTTAAMRIELGVVGAVRPIRVDAVLYKSPDAPSGPTLRVELSLDAHARPKDPPAKILAGLKEHFDKSGSKPVTPDQVSAMTGLDQQTVQDALHVLSRAGKVKGRYVAELNYPVAITDIAE